MPQQTQYDDQHSLITLIRQFYREAQDALCNLSGWEKAAHLFWLAGPFILLIERSPADAWITLLGLTFFFRSLARRDFTWTRYFWVRATFVFWGVSLVAGAVSADPLYALGEAFIWIRFPLFAMATAFWLARDTRLLYAMLISTGLGMITMCGILTAELAILGPQTGRLSWPYGDLVPGNYLAKVGLPAFVVLIALAVSIRGRLAAFLGVVGLLTMGMSVMTGERINFLIRACSGMLAGLVWRLKWRRYLMLVGIEVVAIGALIASAPQRSERYINHFINQLPIHEGSNYYLTMKPGLMAYETSPLLGIGTANFRNMCPEIIGDNPILQCHPHPHNFYIQLLAETGMIGFIFGIVMMWSMVWACYRAGRRAKENVFAATAFIIPLGLFWPVASTSDFFGQWNNIFMWSAIALAMASTTVPRHAVASGRLSQKL